MYRFIKLKKVIKLCSDFSNASDGAGHARRVVMGIGWIFVIDHRFKVNERLSIIIGKTVLTLFYCQSVTTEALLCASVSTNRPVYVSIDLYFNTDI